MGNRSRHLMAERAAAREVPDEISQAFDLRMRSFRADLQSWLLKYEKCMRLKHGPDVVVDLKHESIPNSLSKLVTAFVKPPTEKESDIHE